MGLSIHYKGQLKIAHSLPELIEEVITIAKVEQWKYFVFEKQFPNNCFSNTVNDMNLYGIMISAPESEPLCLSFLSNGKMCGLINFNVLQLDPTIDENCLYSVATKTQYAGSEIHKKLIIILDYINSKFLIEFECTDEDSFGRHETRSCLKKPLRDMPT